jgi:hypothetical protein
MQEQETVARTRARAAAMRARAPTRRLLSLLATPAPAARWERARTSWLASGAFADVPLTAAGDAALRDAGAALAAARGARRRAGAAARPLAIREGNILAALRDPLRAVEFNRPMPLPALVDILRLLWEEEAAAAARAAPAAARPRG